MTITKAWIPGHCGRRERMVMAGRKPNAVHVKSFCLVGVYVVRGVGSTHVVEPAPKVILITYSYIRVVTLGAVI